MFRLAALRFLDNYFRHPKLYLLPILITGFAAVGYFIFTPPAYFSQGTLFVQKESLLASLTSVRNTDFTWETAASVTKGEFDDLLQTDAFVRAVIQRTDIEKEMNQGGTVVNEIIATVRESILVTATGYNQVRVSAKNEDPKIAFQLANATLETFINWKINADQKDSETAHKFFSRLIDSYKKDVDQARANLEAYLITHPEPLKGNRLDQEQLEITRLQSELDQAQARYTNALDKNEEALLAEAQAESDVHQSYVLIDAPVIPEKPELSTKYLILTFATFIIAGLIISVLGIIGGALLDRSFRYPVDVWYGVNLPVLTIVPDVSMQGSLEEIKENIITDRKIVHTKKRPWLRLGVIARSWSEKLQKKTVES